MRFIKSTLIWLVLATIIVFTDQWVKNEILSHFILGQSLTINSFFNLVLVHNAGSSFGFLSEAGGWQRWFLIGVGIVVSLGLFIWFLLQASKNKAQFLPKLAFSLILGGAIGNLIDRFYYGYVIDFIQVHYQNYYWPVFNIADTAISIGVILLILITFFKKNRT